MKLSKWFASLLAVLFFLVAANAVFAQAPPAHRHVVIPQSTLTASSSAGLRAHTNLRILVPDSGPIALKPIANPSELPPVPGLFFETPASLACLYHLVRNPLPGCDPDKTTQNPSGGSGVIAIVDAYDNPNAVADLAIFNEIFGLPPANLSVVYANGTEPPLDPTGGWELEESLDVQYAHAMAPNAQIILVEAASNYFSDLFPAVQLASQLVSNAGGGEVSMSWGSGEFSQETQYDFLFTAPNVVYLASAGDGAGTIWPSVSPNVVSAGGTSISRSTTTGNFILESTWQDAGGGPSLYEPRPHFQDRIAYIVGPTRGTPDISFDANPTTGVWLVDTNLYEGQPGGLFIVGGTSVSAPSLAGIINNAGSFFRSSQAENREIYEAVWGSNSFRDISYGDCGINISNFSTPGWDFCTGVGVNQGLRGK